MPGGRLLYKGFLMRPDFFFGVVLQCEYSIRWRFEYNIRLFFYTKEKNFIYYCEPLFVDNSFRLS